MAAIKAYQGYAHAARDQGEKNEIRAIELDELHHRTRVREMLREVGDCEISFLVEAKMFLIGSIIG